MGRSVLRIYVNMPIDEPMKKGIKKHATRKNVARMFILTI